MDKWKEQLFTAGLAVGGVVIGTLLSWLGAYIADRRKLNNENRVAFKRATAKWLATTHVVLRRMLTLKSLTFLTAAESVSSELSELQSSIHECLQSCYDMLLLTNDPHIVYLTHAITNLLELECTLLEMSHTKLRLRLLIETSIDDKSEPKRFTDAKIADARQQIDNLEKQAGEGAGDKDHLSSLQNFTQLLEDYIFIKRKSKL